MKIIVSHRPATAHFADQVIVLQEGRIVESGPPSSLLKQGGFFARWMEGMQNTASVETHLSTVESFADCSSARNGV